MEDQEFIARFRLRKETMHDLIQEIQDELLVTQDRRGVPIPPHLQVLIAVANRPVLDTGPPWVTRPHITSFLNCYNLLVNPLNPGYPKLYRPQVTDSGVVVAGRCGHDHEPMVTAFCRAGRYEVTSVKRETTN
ncbi:hypothetical protein Pmani_000496 [Petrolisthes manimaculis]|uniref:Uncharacterized protein n=1 Tax=Petrolisthes manimaculis TaxID=1843537 RepID=A0AAE1QLM2_9EUCA|nr:hypothetical protein Pmani_000496 [Petrolisthes manimaculis]